MATAAEIQAELAAGPQTQDALDAALLKYSPAEMAAAFPQFGNVADFNNATQQAYARAQQQQQAANRAAVRADMAVTGEEFRVAEPGGDVQISGPRAPTMSAIPQSEINAARARLTPEQQQYIDWRIKRIDPIQQGTIGDQLARAGVNPYLDAAGAQAEIDRASNREALFAQSGITPETNLRPWTTATTTTPAANRTTTPSEFVIGGGLVVGPGTAPVAGGTAPATGGGLLGGGTAPATGGGLLGGGTTAPAGGVAPAAPANPRIQAIQQWYSANVGRTDPQAQGDLNRWLATSGFTAREINTALPQWGLNDLQNAMRKAIGEVAQQTPFAPAVTQPLNQPYTSIASQLPGGADTRMQEIRNWYAANEGRGDQAGLDRFLASGYSAQEINRALPQFGVNDLERQIGVARQTYPDAALQRQLAAYQATAPGAQFTGTVSPYGLLAQQTQAFRNPYADTLANTTLGGYNPGVYNVLLNETVDPVTGAVIDNGSGNTGAGGASGGDEGSPGGQGGDAAGNTGGGPGTGAPGDAAFAHGGLVTAMFGPDPDGPDEGQINIQRGEYVIKKSAVKKYGQGLLDMINDGKVPAKKMKSLLG
jgi:hypothetical protein